MVHEGHDNLDDLKHVFASPEYAGKWYIQILNSINNGILVTDDQLIVRYVNEQYTRITSIKEKDILGQHLTKVRPGAMLPQVIETGEALVGVYRREGDTEYIVDMAPIIVEGTIIGGVSVVKDITEVRRLSEELKTFARKTGRLKTMVDRIYKAKYTFDDIVGNSSSIQEVVRVAKRASQGDADILITGESGTGKELFAQAIHNASNRGGGPFVALNCAAISPSLIESELFGYEEGAFTGAKKGGRVGLFEIASGGTIFLDEIAELGLEVQAKLLRVLQERSIRRVGETSEASVDIRVMAATNKDLYRMVQEGKFRADVYYRLNVLNVHLPPLAERGQDITLLANKFFQFYFQKIGRKFEVDKQMLKALLHYSWHGNVRELRNVVEYAVNMCDDNIITTLHLPKWFKFDEQSSGALINSLTEMVQDFERRTIQNAIQRYGSSVEAKQRIAKELGISVATLYNKIKIVEMTAKED
jgi:PAS domain S-box-containing protein